MRRWLPLLWLSIGIVAGVAAVRIWQGVPIAELPSAPAPAVTPAAPAAPSVKPAPPVTAPLPPVQLDQGKITGTDEAGQKEWELATESLAIEEAQQRVVLGRVSGRFFKRGTVQLTVAAGQAVYFTRTKHVELSGTVTARTPDGRSLRAPRARYDATRKRLIASGGVTVTQGGMVIRADQVVSDLDLKNTTFSGHVVVTVAEGK